LKILERISKLSLGPSSESINNVLKWLKIGGFVSIASTLGAIAHASEEAVESFDSQEGDR